MAWICPNIARNITRINSHTLTCNKPLAPLRRLLSVTKRFNINGSRPGVRHIHSDTSQIAHESHQGRPSIVIPGFEGLEQAENDEHGQDSTNRSLKGDLESQDASYRRLKLSKKAIKNIRSIERLYKPPRDPYEVETPNVSGIEFDIPLESPPRVPESDHNYEQVKKLVHHIYKSGSDGVYNDALWNRYSQKLRIVSSLLHPSDICLVLHSFAKIRYRDNNMLKAMFPSLVKSLPSISCQGLSLILNSLKRLEMPNYDLIDIVTNEFCLRIDKANVQDIALVANALSFFQVYHVKFWNSLYKCLMIRSPQIEPLQACLLLAAMAKLDIRNPLMLKILKKRLRPAIENNELEPKLLTLVFHSLAKLDFEARYFYDAGVKSFDHFLAQGDDTIDSQSHVLFLYTAVCMLEPRLDVVERSLRQLAGRSEYLKSYKMIKLKYVIDHLKHKHPEFIEGFDEDLKKFVEKVKDYRIKKLVKRLSRWAFEVSVILKEAKVEHRKGAVFDYLCADIYIKDHNFVVKCTGPYSYYTKSSFLTKFARVEQETFSLKGFNVAVLPYYEWNRLRSNEDKIEYLKKFGEDAALLLGKSP